MSPNADDPDVTEAIAGWSQMDWRDHVLGALGNSLLSLRELPPFACDDAQLPFAAMAGCREALYVHARIICEFFVTMPRRDYSADDFLPDWTPPDDLRVSLERVRLVASKHVVHMSRERVPDPATFAPEDTSLEGLTAIARDCFRMTAAFVARFREVPDAWNVAGWEGFLRGPDTEAWVSDLIDLEPWERARSRPDSWPQPRVEGAERST